jgi:hypothetical protein
MTCCTCALKSIPQGSATTIYAAVCPGLEDKTGAYLEDSTICDPIVHALDEVYTHYQSATAIHDDVCVDNIGGQ